MKTPFSILTNANIAHKQTKSSFIPRLGPSRSLLGALLEGTAGRMQCVLFRLANQNTSTANRGAK